MGLTSVGVWTLHNRHDKVRTGPSESGGGEGFPRIGRCKGALRPLVVCTALVRLLLPQQADSQSVVGLAEPLRSCRRRESSPNVTSEIQCWRIALLGKFARGQWSVFIVA